MPRISEGWLQCAAITIFLTVGFGAFGAHGLQHILTEKGRAIFQTAVFYQAIHALGIAVVALTHGVRALPIQRICTVFLLGIVLFSGSLYALAITELSYPELRWLGAITPFGGTLFLIGWGMFAWSLRRPV